MDSVGLELRSLGNLIRRYFEFSSARREIDRATGNNGFIIGFVAEAEESGAEVFPKDVEERFGITRSTASRVLGLMEKKGLIERRPVLRDGRLKRLCLTEKAREIRKEMVADGAAMERVLTKGFSDREKKAILIYIDRMKENLLSWQESEK